MKAIVFDMDGVLFDTERLCMNTWHEMAKERNMEHMDQVAENSIGRNRVAIERVYLDTYGEDFPVAQFLDESRKRMWESIEQNGLKLMEGVMELLNFLRENGYRIAIASSSGDQVIERYLGIADMRQYFDRIVGGNQIKNSKPSPDIYLKACESLGADPADTIAVEDSPNGIRSAYHAGMIPVMIPDLIQPDEEIRQMYYKKYASLTEFREALENKTF